MLRSLLLKLIFAFFAILVANSALLGGYVLAGLSTDPAAQRVFWWLMMAGLILTAVDLVLIVATLCLIQIGNEPSQE